MVFLGQWPYQHTISLAKIHSDTGISLTYSVDTDTTIPMDKVPQDYKVDSTLYVCMSKDIHDYVAAYKEQLFPPPIPSDIRRILNKKEDPYDVMNKEAQGSGAVMVVNGQQGDTMEDIGAQWNPHLGLWVISVEHLQAIRERRRDTYDGKLYYEPHHDRMLKAWGDATPHIEALKAAGATYHDRDNVWYIPLSAYDTLRDILFKA